MRHSSTIVSVCRMKLSKRIASIQHYYCIVYKLALLLSLAISFFLIFSYTALPPHKVNAQSIQDISSFLIKSPGDTISVISDRDESIEKFFQRNFIMVGNLIDLDLKRIINPLEVNKQAEFYVSYPYNNYEGNLQPAYGRTAKISPIENSVKRLFLHRKLSLSTPVFRVDEEHLNVYHLVGFMQHNPAGFFSSSILLNMENFSPQNLLNINTEK